MLWAPNEISSIKIIVTGYLSSVLVATYESLRLSALTLYVYYLIQCRIIWLCDWDDRGIWLLDVLRQNHDWLHITDIALVIANQSVLGESSVFVWVRNIVIIPPSKESRLGNLSIIYPKSYSFSIYINTAECRSLVDPTFHGLSKVRWWNRMVARALVVSEYGQSYQIYAVHKER